ncbi:lysM domain-containing protein [Apiospora arundinis]|uniref:LysM domain-containing protein n=1 Tax=Apiospora arundinis TaxID=335852 RepID=A0ABR2HMF6_9PEZI
MFPSIRLLGVIPLLASATMAERSLPADLQVDLIFPQHNTTYTPAQWFPVVFGAKNLDAVWPMGISLGVEVIDNEYRKIRKGPSWKYELASIDFTRALNSTTPGEYVFHIPAVNMTNGTTGSYTVAWELNIEYRCFENSTDRREEHRPAREGWSNSPNGYARRFINFHTAPGGQVPDIEATVNSCQEPNVNSSTAVRVTKMGETHWKYPREPCPWLETDIRPSKCAFQPAAKELAANVSEAMLAKMRCKEGSWQTITAPCPRKSTASSLYIMGVSLSYMLALSFGFALFIVL